MFLTPETPDQSYPGKGESRQSTSVCLSTTAADLPITLLHHASNQSNAIPRAQSSRSHSIILPLFHIAVDRG